MTFYATILLCSAAILGLTLIFLGIRYHRGSLMLAIAHASTALLGFGFLITQIINGETNKYNNIAALLLALAITGGIMIFLLRDGKKPASLIAVSFHAMMALSGIGILLLGQT